MAEASTTEHISMLSESDLENYDSNQTEGLNIGDSSDTKSMSTDETTTLLSLDPVSKKMKLEDGNKKRWTNEEVIRLIELFEDKTILWNVFDKDYHKRDRSERDAALGEMALELNTSVLDIRAKLNTLRAQLGRELKKVKRISKNGQPNDEYYHSSWMYWKRLQFLVPVMIHTIKNRQESVHHGHQSSEDIMLSEDELVTMVQQNKPTATVSNSTATSVTILQDDDDSHDRYSLSPDSTHHNSLHHQQQQHLRPKLAQQVPLNEHITVLSNGPIPLPPKITSVGTISNRIPLPPIHQKYPQTNPATPSQQSSQRVSHFTMYIDEKLSTFDRRTRCIAEKRITDILFDMEMNVTSTSDCSRPCPQTPLQDSMNSSTENHHSAFSSFQGR